jgi:hypothetical protein
MIIDVKPLWTRVSTGTSLVPRRAETIVRKADPELTPFENAVAAGIVLFLLAIPLWTLT